MSSDTPLPTSTADIPTLAPSADPIGAELQRYDEHLRDVQGLSPGTRKGYLRVATHQYVEADLAMKEQALTKLHEPDTALQRYRAPYSLIDFLRTL